MTLMTIDPETLLRAYSVGLFPMADSREAEEVFWVEPRDRAILPLKGFHLSRSLKKTLRRDVFAFRCNTAFSQVVAHCAAAAPDREESWINGEIRESYALLSRLGHAHSVECWQDDRLVGGLYGVSIGRVFCGESMFSLTDNASKAALAALVAAMRIGGFQLLDCQFMTDHLASLGAIEMTQDDYIDLLDDALTGSRFARPGARSAQQRPDRPRLAGTIATGRLLEPLAAGETAAQTYSPISSSKSSIVGSGRAGAGREGAGRAGGGLAEPGEPSLPDAFALLLADGDEGAAALADRASGAASESAEAAISASSSPGKRIAQFLSQTS